MPAQILLEFAMVHGENGVIESKAGDFSMWSRFHTARTESGVTNRRRYRPLLEELESRLAPAGNVTAVVSSGSLIITTGNDNTAIMVNQPSAGKITLTGDGATINGSTGPVTFSKVTKNLIINFGKGDDALTFDETTSITISGDIVINGGKGNLTIATANEFSGTLNVGGDLIVSNQAGSVQKTSLININIQGDAQFLNLGSAGIITIGSIDEAPTPPFANFIKGDLLITNGSADYNETSLSSLQVKGDVRILNGGGFTLTSITHTSIAGDLSIKESKNNFGQVYFADTNIGRDLQIVEGTQSHSFLALSVTVNGAADLQTGNGDDTVYIGGSSFGRTFQLRTGKGADTVSIGMGFILFELIRFKAVTQYDENGNPLTKLVPILFESTLDGGPVTFNDNVSVNLGDGDDTLNLALGAKVKFKRKATFDGQSGSNSATANAANLPALPLVSHFQITWM